LEHSVAPQIMDYARKLSGCRVLVTGGAGFVGSQLVRELIDLKCSVAVYDNFLHGTRENLAEIKEQVSQIFIGDVLDEWTLMKAFHAFQPEYVFDFVGDTYVPTAYDVPKRFFRINVEGTLNILMACKMSMVKRVLYVSSTEVYGEAQQPLMDEDHKLNPMNTYAVSKTAADRLCFTLHKEHSIPVVIARIFNSYGPRETEPYIIPEIITQLDKRDDVELGNVKAKRDFTYVSDTCKGLIAAICSDIPNGDAVNVGSGFVASVEELVHKIAGIMGKTKYRIRVDERRFRPFDIDLFICNNTKLRKTTGWQPTIDLDKGLKLTVDWFKSHGSRWSWENWTEGTILYDRAG